MTIAYIHGVLERSLKPFPAGSSIAPQLIYSQTQLEHSRNTAWAAHGKKCLQFHTHDGIVYTITNGFYLM